MAVAADYKHHVSSLASNFLASASLIALIGLGIYVNLSKLVVEGPPTPGFYQIVPVDQNNWNIGCTITGTVVGLLVSFAMSAHDGVMTRREVMSERGTVALYTRPLSGKRGIEQVWHRQANLPRMLLVLLKLTATLLCAAATVATFSIHDYKQQVFNPMASYPLTTYGFPSFLSSAVFSDYYGAVFPRTITAETSILESFLYRSAHIAALKSRDRYDEHGEPTLWMPESGTIGSTRYASLETKGVGLNASSYTTFSGLPSGFEMPGKYTFEHLEGYVFGTHINVNCTDSTKEYTASHVGLGLPWNRTNAWTVSNGDGLRFQVIQNANWQGIERSHVALGALLRNTSIGEPLLTIAVILESYGDVYVYDCGYHGNESIVPVMLESAVSPIQILQPVLDGPSVQSPVRWALAEQAYLFLARTGGGAVANAWKSAELSGSSNRTAIKSILSTALSQTAEAQISLVRQNREVANEFRSEVEQTRANVTMTVTINRIGGGQFSWLSVYAVLLIGVLVGVLQTCCGNAIQCDVQDTVTITNLSLNNTSVCPKSRLKLNGRHVEVVVP